MKPLTIVGVLLILAGIAGLIVGRITYTTDETALKAGPLVVTAQKEHSIRVPDIAGIVAVVVGGLLVVVSRRGRRS
jgi:hypothetical protein